MRSVWSVAPSSSTGPSVQTGVSWTKRSPTIDGETMTALASSGTLTPASYDIVTVTSVPDGVTVSTVPIGTPRTRTSLPS